MTNDDRPSTTTPDPTASAADLYDAPRTSDDGEAGCGLEVVGVALIGFGVLISMAIPVVIVVGWIPVVIGALVLRHAKRRNAKDAEPD